MRISLKKIKSYLFIIYIAIGVSGAVGYFFNLPKLIALSQGSAVVPIPLVFDAPQGYQFWQNNYHASITFEGKRVIEIPIDRDLLDRFPKNVVVLNSLAIALAVSPILENNQWQNIARYSFCSPGTLIKILLPKEEDKVIKVNLKITNMKNPDQVWVQEVKCY